MRDGTVELRDSRRIIRFERRLAHPIDRVWTALTDPGELEAWLARARIDLRPGGEVVLEWRNTDDEGRHAVFHAAVTELDPPHVFEITGDIHGRVRWELRPDGDEATILRFVNETPAPDEAIGRTRSGWHFHLDVLEDFVADGTRVDWPNWPRERWERIDAHYAAQEAVTGLYRRLVDGWNAGDAEAMAGPVAPDGLMIGFDGSQLHGRREIAAELGRIFADHRTATYVTKVRSVRQLGPDAALLHAVAGMVPPGGAEIMPDRNAVQTVVAHRGGDGWAVVLFQTTPAQLHGRPELADALTAELTALLAG
jgi:uncharacterized protein (TIGR02246 family)